MAAERRILGVRKFNDVITALSDDKAVRAQLSPSGRLHMEGSLPFIVVYRDPTDREDPGTDRLLLAGSSFMATSADPRYARDITEKILALAKNAVDRFGGFLVIEIWTSGQLRLNGNESSPPGFKVLTMSSRPIPLAVRSLVENLRRITISRRRAVVESASTQQPAPTGMNPLVTLEQLKDLGAHLIGIEIDPVYVNQENGTVFPGLFRSYRRLVKLALERSLYEFTNKKTTYEARSYLALGRSSLVRTVYGIDRRISAVDGSFDLLIDATPVNGESAWEEFSRDKFERTPRFHYRPRAIDPGEAKELLYRIPVERVEDPTLMSLFHQKQMEIDRKLTMLHDIGTKRFLWGGLQVYGEVTSELRSEAEKVLDRTTGNAPETKKSDCLGAAEFQQAADADIQWYQAEYPGFTASTVVAGDIYSGLLTSGSCLYIGNDVCVQRSRVKALLNHEVGAHLVTLDNGDQQRLRTLRTGLPDYEATQEGLAVFMEYLAGGLSINRLSVLAARVIACHSMVSGAEFVEVFRMLTKTYGFSQKNAFSITLRVYRGGGLVKDAIYLRGLLSILKYVGEGNDLDLLFAGKFSIKHAHIIRELLHRQILTPPRIIPRIMSEDNAKDRLAMVGPGFGLLDLIDLASVIPTVRSDP